MTAAQEQKQQQQQHFIHSVLGTRCVFLFRIILLWHVKIVGGIRKNQHNNMMRSLLGWLIFVL